MIQSPARESTIIQGVYTVELRAFSDERGRFMETFRREWFPWVEWTKLQTNRSDSVCGVLRGLHYHRKQIDYWYVPKGRIRAGLVDLRQSSPTYRASQTVEMGEQHDVGLFVPEGVAHGFVALSDCTLMYIVNNYYDGGKDEYGIAWDDPDANINWGIDAPLLSERDKDNPLISQLSPDALPD